MTHDLTDLLTRRAERARTPHDPDSVIALVTTRAEAAGRTRRNRLTIASGAALVVAAATVGFAIADLGSTSHRPSTDPVGGGPTGSAVVRHDHHATVLPEIGPLHGTATRRGVPIGTRKQNVQAVERKMAARQQRLARLQQQRRAAKLHNARTHRTGRGAATLVPIAPAPPAAEISLGLVPEGFQYLGLDDADTYYGPSGTPPSKYFSDGIVVDVHDFIGDDKDYTLTVDGKPAAFYRSDGFTTVRVRYDKKVDVGFQAPPAAKLTEAQALKMAATLDVRSTEHQTHG